jgi:hypothetical protein
MNAFRFLAASFALTLAAAAFAQSSERGSIPPGQSRDGAAPAEGAIKGGAILPGESAGMPERRCEELSGTLREDCLKQKRDAAAGGTAEPRATEPSATDIRKKSPERAD